MNSMQWKFKKYEQDDVQRNSSSDKFFKEAAESDSLIREFIQNSLDASDTSQQPVQVIIKRQILKKSECKHFLSDLHPHLKACDIEVNEPVVKFIILEDFNTKGLQGNNLKDFFQRDNITNKTRGGGSHGIGKAVFSASSKINTFFGYSLFGDTQNKLKKEFRGRSVLKTHTIPPDEYYPDGVLRVPSIDAESKQFIEKLFTRKNQKGLSVAIPYCDVNINEIKQSCLNQFYMPIINKRLKITVQDKDINDNTLLKFINNPKVHLATDYKTIPSNQIKQYTVKETDWKNKKFPQLKKQDLTMDNECFVFSFKIEIPFKTGKSKHGNITLVIKKTDEINDDPGIDCWRDNLLIPSALGPGRKEKEYTTILLIENNPLSDLLRKLEDPGHTRWQTGSLSKEITNEYKNVRNLVKFVKKLPFEVISQIKYQPVNQDLEFFSDYFPATPHSHKKDATEQGHGNTSGGEEMPANIETYFPNFTYTEHKNRDGFKLKLKNNKNPPKTIEVKTAYGTNNGNAFSNYDKRDFEFNRDIIITVNHGKKEHCDENRVKCSILNKNFSIAFSGFDPNRELRIEVK